MADQPRCPYAWSRRNGESETAYAAFDVFVQLGAARSLVEVGARVKKSQCMVKRWSGKWDWPGRARAYDNHNAAVEQRARDKVRAGKASDWEKRRLDENESAYQVALLLRQRSKAMLDFPLAERTVKERGKTADGTAILQDVTIKPGSWTFATAVSMAKTSVELGMMAVDAALAEDDAFDPLNATLEECQEWIAQAQAKRLALRNAAERLVQ